MDTNTTPAAQLPLWEAEVTFPDGAPVTDPALVAEAAAAACRPWGAVPANAPEAAPEAPSGGWLVPLSDEAAGALGYDAQVATSAGAVWVCVS